MVQGSDSIRMGNRDGSVPVPPFATTAILPICPTTTNLRVDGTDKTQS